MVIDVLIPTEPDVNIAQSLRIRSSPLRITPEPAASLLHFQLLPSLHGLLLQCLHVRLDLTLRGRRVLDDGRFEQLLRDGNGRRRLRVVEVRQVAQRFQSSTKLEYGIGDVAVLGTSTSKRHGVVHLGPGTVAEDFVVDAAWDVVEGVVDGMVVVLGADDPQEDEVHVHVHLWTRGKLLEGQKSYQYETRISDNRWCTGAVCAVKIWHCDILLCRQQVSDEHEW